MNLCLSIHFQMEMGEWQDYGTHVFCQNGSQIEKFQDEYYNAIAKCHINGDSNVFIEFMLKQIDKILEEILLRADEQDEHVTEYVKKLLNVMEYEVPYTSTVLMEKLGLK